MANCYPTGKRRLLIVEVDGRDCPYHKVKIHGMGQVQKRKVVCDHFDATYGTIEGYLCSDDNCPLPEVLPEDEE